MILKVLKDTHPKLSTKIFRSADPKDLRTKILAVNMVETMNSHKAVGLACNQVDSPISVRMIAVSINEYKGIMYNPIIVSDSDTIAYMKEGCLSSKQEISVPRKTEIIVIFDDLQGKHRQLELKGFSARVVQHEIDHLDGIQTKDYLLQKETQIKE